MVYFISRNQNTSADLDEKPPIDIPVSKNETILQKSSFCQHTVIMENN